MPTYPVNPADPTSPTDQQGAKQGAEEFRALKALIASMIVASSASAGPRQVIQSAILDANGYNNALTVGAGLRPGLTATAADPLHLSIANGFTGGKAVNSDESIIANNADILGVDLPINTTAYLARNYGASYESTLFPPQYGYAFDRTQASLLHFEDAGGIPICGFGNQYTITGAAITVTKPAYGTKSLDCSGGLGTNVNVKRAETAAITTLGPDSWETSCVVWFDVQPNAAVLHNLMHASNAAGLGFSAGWGETGGNRRAAISTVSSDGTTSNIAGTTFGVTNLAVGIWYRFRFVFDALGGTYRLYVAAGGSAAAPVWAAEVQEISVASTARICAVTRFIWGCSWSGAAYANGISGFIDECRFIRCATKVGTETPGVAPNTYPFSITTHKVNFFSIPKMQMFEVTAESTVANTNPTMVSALRLFLGEADTSGAAITAIRNYAVRGQFIGAVVMPAQSTTATVSHNIGVPQIEQRFKARIKTTLLVPEGYVVGAEVDLTMGSGDSAGPGPRGANNGISTRLTSKITNDNLGGLTGNIQSGSYVSLFGAGKTELVLYANRGW